MNITFEESQILFFILSCLSGIAFFIFLLRINQNDTNYEEMVIKLNSLKENDLEKIEVGKKEIKKINQEISRAKKKLGI